MPPRVVTISDHIDCPTGFGVQHRHLATALARAGLEVHSLGLWDSRPLATTPDGVARYPGGQGPEEHRRAWAMYHALLRPDLVITLGDLETFAHLNRARRDFAWCHWLPVDAEPYPSRRHRLMLRYDRLVLMSHFGLGVVRPHLADRVPLHLIPHGVDTRVFRPLEDPLELRRRWSRRLGVALRPDDFLLLARDTNQWRKQQPLLLDALARLPADVKLLLHCRPVAHPAARGWDLPHLARHVYGLGGRVVFTGRGRSRPDLSPAELAELDNLADLRVSASQGEGFGVITIEAMACGTPTLITDGTTARELLQGLPPRPSPLDPLHSSLFTRPSPLDPLHSSLFTRPSTLDPRPSPLDPFGPAGEPVRVAAWTVEQERGLLRPVLDPADLAARVLALREDRGGLARYGVAGLRRVLAAYTVDHMARAWVALARAALDEMPSPSGPGPSEAEGRGRPAALRTGG